MSNNGMSIGQLAQVAGVTPRTIRYYLQMGLLPPPSGAGKNRFYSDDHRLRLLLIRRLQEAHYPLEEIRLRLAGMRDEDIQTILEEGVKRAGPLEEMRARLSEADSLRDALPCFRAPYREAGPLRETWVRMEIAPGVELHYRAPTPRRVQEALERLITEGRELMGKALGVENS